MGITQNILPTSDSFFLDLDSVCVCMYVYGTPFVTKFPFISFPNKLISYPNKLILYLYKLILYLDKNAYFVTQ